MAQHRISVSRLVSASAERVYSIIADYEHGHAQILPKPPFVSMTVTRGGFGAGTEFDLVMRVLGKREIYHGVVTEPDIQHVIAESYVGTNTITTFTIDPREGGTEVTITTDTDVGNGLFGAIGRRIATRLLRPTYVKELEKLAAVLATGAGSNPVERRRAAFGGASRPARSDGGS
jgi:hypothetical protein